MLIMYLSLIDNEEDQSAFTDIYNSHYKQMFYLAKSITHNDADAEDVVHDTFMTILRKYKSVLFKLDNATDLRNYLLKCTKNTALNHIKAAKKNPLSLDGMLEDNPDIPILSDDSLLDTICTKYDYDKVLDAMQSLNKAYFDPLYCHFVLELSVPETARHLNQSFETTKKQLVRGKKLLLAKLNMIGD